MAPLRLLLLWLAGAAAALPVFLDNAVDKVEAGFKTRGRRVVHDTITVRYSPALLVKDEGDISQTVVEIKSEDGDWVQPNNPPTKRMGQLRAKFSNVIPCKSHELRIIVTSKDGEEAILPLPMTVGPASAEEIEESSFSPAAPTNVDVRTEGGQLLVSWDASECATTYGVFASGSQEISKTTGDSSIALDVGSCESYEVSVIAAIGDKESEEVIVNAKTVPSEGAAEKLMIDYDADVNSITATWDGWTALPCVAMYSAQLCSEDGVCREPTEVPRSSGAGKASEFTATDLEECSTYTLRVTPLYPDLTLPAKEIKKITTRAPAMDNVEEKLGEVTAEAGDYQKVTIGWSAVKCASKYEVYQKQSMAGSDWELMDTIDEASLEIAGVPCTKYSYGVKVVINGQSSGMVETTNLLTIPMDTNVAFVLSSLHMDPTMSSLSATWEHARCIDEYRVEVTEVGSSEEPLEVPVEMTLTHEQSVMAMDLKPCTDYTMKVFATTDSNSELAAEDKPFTTLSPPASAPADLTASLNPTTNMIDVSFSSVQCASGYNVYKKLGDGELEMVQATEGTSMSLEAPQPCTDYSITVSSVVKDEESDKSEVEQGTVPSDTSDSAKPSFAITNAENSTVELDIATPNNNNKCMVEEFNVRFLNTGVNSDWEERTLSAEDEKVIDDFPGVADSSMRLEVRIKYSDGNFSPWKSSAEPEIVMPEDPNPDGLLVPIVIGILVAVVVLVVVIFFIVKRKRSQSKYDTESAQNDEESKKLKESNPE